MIYNPPPLHYIRACQSTASVSTKELIKHHHVLHICPRPPLLARHADPQACRKTLACNGPGSKSADCRSASCKPPPPPPPPPPPCDTCLSALVERASLRAEGSVEHVAHQSKSPSLGSAAGLEASKGQSWRRMSSSRGGEVGGGGG